MGNIPPISNVFFSHTESYTDGGGGNFNGNKEIRLLMRIGTSQKKQNNYYKDVVKRQSINCRIKDV